MEYFPRVYTLSTLIVTLFPRILGSGAWQDFLSIGVRFTQKEPNSYRWPKISYIYTAINICYSQDDTESTWELIVVPLDIHFFEFFDISNPNSSSRIIWITSYFYPSSWFYFHEICLLSGYSMSKSVAEVRIVQRKHDGFMMCWEATWKHDIFSFDFNFF